MLENTSFVGWRRGAQRRCRAPRPRRGCRCSSRSMSASTGFDTALVTRVPSTSPTPGGGLGRARRWRHQRERRWGTGSSATTATSGRDEACSPGRGARPSSWSRRPSAFASALMTRKNTRMGATAFRAETKSVPSSVDDLHVLGGEQRPASAPTTRPMTMRLTRLTSLYFRNTSFTAMRSSFHERRAAKGRGIRARRAGDCHQRAPSYQSRGGGEVFEAVRGGDTRRCCRWCGRKDLNLHEFPHQNLNLARLPIPPRPHGVCIALATTRSDHDTKERPLLAFDDGTGRDGQGAHSRARAGNDGARGFSARKCALGSVGKRWGGGRMAADEREDRAVRCFPRSKRTFGHSFGSVQAAEASRRRFSCIFREWRGSAPAMRILRCASARCCYNTDDLLHCDNGANLRRCRSSGGDGGACSIRSS